MGVFSDIKKNRIQTYTDQDLTFVVPKGGVECFGIETEQLEDVDQGYKSIHFIGIDRTGLFSFHQHFELDKYPCIENEKGFFEFDVTKGGFEMTIDCWITEVAEGRNPLTTVG